MVCLLKRKGKLYKKYRLDIWGLYRSKYNVIKLKKWRSKDSVIRFWLKWKKFFKEYRQFRRQRYSYKIWDRKRMNFPRRLKKNYIEPRVLYNYFVYLSKYKFILYVKNSRKGIEPFFNKYLQCLEFRLSNVLLRLGFFSNIFLMKDLLKFDLVYSIFYKKSLNNVNYILKLGEMCCLSFNWLKIFWVDYFLKLKWDIFLNYIDLGIYCDYYFFYFFFFRYIKKDSLRYPIKLDIYRAFDFIGPWR